MLYKVKYYLSISRSMSIPPNIWCWFKPKLNCFSYTIYETAKLNLTGLQSNLFKVFVKYSNLDKNQWQLLFSLKLFSIGKIQIGSILLRSLSYFESPSTINISSPLGLFQFFVFGTKRERWRTKNIWKWIYNKWRTTFPIRMRRVKERLQTKTTTKVQKITESENDTLEFRDHTSNIKYLVLKLIWIGARFWITFYRLSTNIVTFTTWACRRNECLFWAAHLWHVSSKNFSCAKSELSLYDQT